jgi:hypothetical protein
VCFRWVAFLEGKLIDKGRLEVESMEKSQLKKGRIEIIGEDKVTILNLDGLCRDTLAIIPEEALRIKDEIGFGEEVLYFVKGGKLVQIELEGAFPELQQLYEALPKEIGCQTSG